MPAAQTRNPPAPMLRDRPRANMLYRTAAVLLRSHYQQLDPEDVAKALYGRDHGLDTVIRAASSPATLTNPAWAGLATQNLIRDLIQQITALSAAAALMEAGVRIDTSGYASVTVPGRLYDPTAAGAWIPEGAAIPVRIPLLTAGPQLVPRKLAVISAYTREMVEVSAIEAFTRMAITEAAAAQLDARMFSITPADASGPGGILIGATVVDPADPAGAGGWIISKDIGALIGALANHGGGLQPVLVAAPAQCAALMNVAAVKISMRYIRRSHLRPALFARSRPAVLFPRSMRSQISTFPSGVQFTRKIRHRPTSSSEAPLRRR